MTIFIFQIIYLPEIWVCDWACCWSCWWCICNWICCCWCKRSRIEWMSLRRLVSKLSIRDAISASWFFIKLKWKLVIHSINLDIQKLNQTYSLSLALQHDVGACWKLSSSGLLVLFILPSPLSLPLAPQLHIWLLTALNVIVSRGCWSSEMLRLYEPFGLPVGVTIQ